MDNPTIRAIDRACAAAGGISDYRLAKLLGVAQTTISNYRTGNRQLDDAVAVKIAHMIGVDPAELLAEVAAERSKDEGARTHWLRLAALARAACLVATLGVAILAGSAMTGRVGLTPDALEVYPANVSACIEQNHIQCVQSTAEITALSMPFFVAVLLLILGVWIPPSGDRKTATPTPTDAH